MRILDRERYWAFLKAYVICFVALVGLYVVIDAFSKIDEFSEMTDSTIQLFRNMGWYYFLRLSQFYDQLCGVISMMAAIFTVTWMQKNNEHLAMLSAGVGTKRIIRPVLVSAVLVSLLAVANQELILARLGEDLQKTPDHDGLRNATVVGREDSRRVLLDGKDAERKSNTVLSFTATFPVELTGQLSWVEAKQARYIPPDDRSAAPLKGGWLLRDVTIKPVATTPPDVLVAVNDPTGYPPASGKVADFGPPTHFLKSDLSFVALTRTRQWYQFATTVDLIEALADPSNAPEKLDISVFLHGRLIRPLASFTLMLLSLPLVLGGSGRNMFINLGLALLTSGIFYAGNFLAQYLGSNAVFSPELAAWAPLIVFGTFVVARWDTIRT